MPFYVNQGASNFYMDVKILLKINDQNFYMAPDGNKSFIFKTFAYVVTPKFTYVFNSQNLIKRYSSLR